VGLKILHIFVASFEVIDWKVSVKNTYEDVLKDLRKKLVISFTLNIRYKVL